jgi:serine/threonine protein kinase
MAKRSSTFELLGLPQQFGVVVLTLALVFVISPYSGGADFGIFKIPAFPPNIQHVLRILGPLVFGVCLGLFVPAWPSRREEEGVSGTSPRTQVEPHVPHSSATSPPPERVQPRKLIVQTSHSRIEEAIVLGERYVIKSTREDLVDIAALRTISERGPEGFFDRNYSVSIDAPSRVWIEGNQVCELHKFIDGISLYEVVKRNRYRLKGRYLGWLFTRTVEALTWLHELNILHRDVNPTNMLLTKNGRIALVDVSFACFRDNQRVPVSNAAFSAPEQLLKNAVPQSDFYGLAAATCFIATGEEPVLIDDERLRKQVLNVNFGPFRSDLETPELLYKMLRPNVSDRPDSYRDLLLDPATDPVWTSVDAVYDLGPLGFMVLSPFCSKEVGTRSEVSSMLRVALEHGPVRDEKLRSDIEIFLSGSNPWLV